MQSTAGDSRDGDAPAAAVRAQLARILASEGFVSSQRLCRFLRFIVEETLENDAERLKEFVIAIEVFDRDENYDPNIDSIVRVEARRLRTKLKAYYEGPGNRDPILIGLRPGSYVPLFRPLTPAEPLPLSPVEAAAVQYTTVAVLPFVNMSPEPEQDYFCDGITEEILNALASIENLAVVARTSAFQFKGKAVDVREVGTKLCAQVIVEGSVRKAGNQLRITAQAIDAAKGYHLWSETYRRELQDAFAIQEEISIAIANTLRAKLPARALRAMAAHHVNLEAYTGYLRAVFLLHQQTVAGLHAAMTQFRELTRLYPDYADPYAGIATTHAVLSLFGIVSGSEVLPELRRNAERAVRLNPESADAWTVLGGISAHWEFDWEQADSRFRRALAFQPSSYTAHSWYGMVLTMLGRFTEAESELSLAVKLDPLCGSSYARHGFLSYVRGDDTRALSQLNESFKADPDFPDARMVLALVYMRQGDYRAAAEVLSRNLDRMPIALHMGFLAGACFRMGKTAEGRAWLSKLDHMATKQYVTPMARACACVGMQDLDGAFDALHTAVEQRTIFTGVIGVDPYYEPLRRDSRYTKLLRTINLQSSQEERPTSARSR